MGEKVNDPRVYYQNKYQGVSDLPGVGPAAANKLSQGGYATVQAISTATTMEIMDCGLGEETAKKIIRAARKCLEIKFIKGDELAALNANKTRMTTGCPSLDALLEGGVDTSSITEFSGEFDVGKSQVAQQLAVAVQLPVEKGGLDGACLYVDTEQTFRPERIVEMAEYLGVDNPLKRIIYAKAFTSEHQVALLNSCDEVMKENGVRLIVIDSLMAHFRSEYPGREVLAPRQQKLNKHLHKLKRLSIAFEAVAVVTNQVTAIPDSTHGPQAAKPIGGHVLGHAAHSRIIIRKGRNNLRIAKLFASPFLPAGGERPFFITARGIEGDADVDEAPPQPTASGAGEDVLDI